jgi:hypothetical protein
MLDGLRCVVAQDDGQMYGWRQLSGFDKDYECTALTKLASSTPGLLSRWPAWADYCRRVSMVGYYNNWFISSVDWWLDAAPSELRRAYDASNLIFTMRLNDLVFQSVAIQSLMPPHQRRHFLSFAYEHLTVDRGGRALIGGLDVGHGDAHGVSLLRAAYERNEAGNVRLVTCSMRESVSSWATAVSLSLVGVAPACEEYCETTGCLVPANGNLRALCATAAPPPSSPSADACRRMLRSLEHSDSCNGRGKVDDNGSCHCWMGPRNGQVDFYCRPFERWLGYHGGCCPADTFDAGPASSARSHPWGLAAEYVASVNDGCNARGHMDDNGSCKCGGPPGFDKTDLYCHSRHREHSRYNSRCCLEAKTDQPSHGADGVQSNVTDARLSKRGAVARPRCAIATIVSVNHERKRETTKGYDIPSDDYGEAQVCGALALFHSYHVSNSIPCGAPCHHMPEASSWLFCQRPLLPLTCHRVCHLDARRHFLDGAGQGRAHGSRSSAPQSEGAEQVRSTFHLHDGT